MVTLISNILENPEIISDPKEDKTISLDFCRNMLSTLQSVVNANNEEMSKKNGYLI